MTSKKPKNQNYNHKNHQSAIVTLQAQSWYTYVQACPWESSHEMRWDGTAHICIFHARVTMS